MADELVWLSWIALGAGLISAVVVAADLLFVDRQAMWIMNVVWPLTALYSGPLGLWGYFTLGRKATKSRFGEAKRRGDEKPRDDAPLGQAAAVGATHCGAGCMLGDLCAEWLTFFVPVTILGRKIFGTWAVDFAFAFVFGIAFQYFTIVPMRKLSFGRGLAAAVKADALSLTAWQVGMYGWMAVAVFLIFQRDLEKTSPVFWFMMQIAMLAGFATSYPVNRLLIRFGWKERM